eukprot:gene6046-4341_t
MLMGANGSHVLDAAGSFAILQRTTSQVEVAAGDVARRARPPSQLRHQLLCASDDDAGGAAQGLAIKPGRRLNGGATSAVGAPADGSAGRCTCGRRASSGRVSPATEYRCSALGAEDWRLWSHGRLGAQLG